LLTGRKRWKRGGLEAKSMAAAGRVKGSDSWHRKRKGKHVPPKRAFYRGKIEQPGEIFPRREGHARWLSCGRQKFAVSLAFLTVTKGKNSVHNLFTPWRPVPAASGERLETMQKCDKKKPELYFRPRAKKILTQKTTCAVGSFFPSSHFVERFFFANFRRNFSGRRCLTLIKM
jgi:hypothetical protein